VTALTLSRGDLRALLLATAPHAGRETDDTPLLGRVRFVPTGSHLHAWCTDFATSVTARAVVTEHLDAELACFDLPLGAVRAALAVFKPPAGDARMHWCDEQLRLEVTREHVVMTEVGQLVNGRSLQVNRIVPANQADRYPDVPRMLLDALTAAPSHGPAYRARAEHVARFVSVAAWHGAHVRLHGVESPAVVLVRIGEHVLGMVPASVLTANGLADERVQLRDWSQGLAPLRRPEEVDVPAVVVDGLRAQAASLLRDGAGFVDLQVVLGRDTDRDATRDDDGTVDL